MDNMELWNEFMETPPKVTKAFQKGGGFKGKAIDPMYIIRRLTEKFGPVGMGWGWEIVDEGYHTGHPFSNKYTVDNKTVETNYEGNTIIHKIQLRLWYMVDVHNKTMEKDVATKFLTGPQFGLTTFVGEYKSGPFTDEEHAKKSVTDAIGKCAVTLGVAADVHMGLHDNNKYVHDLQKKLDEEAGKKPKTKAGADDTPPSESEDLSELSDEERKKRGLISKKQMKRLHTIADEQSWPITATKSLLAEKGYSSSYEIKWQDYKSIVEQIQSLDMSEDPKEKELEDIPI